MQVRKYVIPLAMEGFASLIRHRKAVLMWQSLI